MSRSAHYGLGPEAGDDRAKTDPLITRSRSLVLCETGGSFDPPVSRSHRMEPKDIDAGEARQSRRFSAHGALGQWVYVAGIYPVANGTVAVKMYDRGANPNGELHGAGQARVTCRAT